MSPKSHVMRVVRAAVTGPLVVALATVAWVTLPGWFLIAIAASPLIPGRWRLPRMLWLMLLYLTCEAVMLMILLGYWLAAGGSRRVRSPYWQELHYDLVQGVMTTLFAEAKRVLKLEIKTAGPTPDRSLGRPVLVCSRHAGPGDSFTLIHALMNWYQREPRVVLKDTLAWDPAIGVILNRLPARFITTRPQVGTNLEQEVGALAAGLDHNDAFVIFPEGGNFTPARRQRAIDRLRKLGFERMAQRAEAMTHVLAPKPGGLLAALEGAPDADVMLVAHTGLDHVVTATDLWRELPMDKQLIMGWWRVPREQVPTDREAQIEWLYDWWERIDDWIEQHRPVPVEAA